MLLPRACQRVKGTDCAQHHKIWLVRLSKEKGAVAAILTSACFKVGSVSTLPWQAQGAFHLLRRLLPWQAPLASCCYLFRR